MATRHQEFIATILVRERARITRIVASMFPRMSRQQVEEAVADGELAALINPSLDDEAAVIRFVIVVARRQARGTWRRRAYSAEVGGDSLDHVRVGDGGDMEARIHAARQARGVPELIERAGAMFGPGCVDELVAALRELADDDSASVEEVAQRHHVSRYYVSRARAWMRREAAR